MFADLVGCKYTADRPKQVYVGDFSYLLIGGGSSMYLATVIDCYPRRLAGFAIADHVRTSLVHDALTAAKASEAALKGQCFTPATAVFIPRKPSKNLCSTWVTQSMGDIGTSAANALAESFNAAMKREVLQDSHTFTIQLVCRREVFRWCTKYTTMRRHSWCNHLAPNVFERQDEATLKRAS